MGCLLEETRGEGAEGGEQVSGEGGGDKKRKGERMVVGCVG